MHGSRAEQLPATGFLHDLALCASTDEVVAVAAAFLRSGLDAGHTAVIATAAPTAAALQEELADDRVLVLERQAVYPSRTPAAIATFRRLAAEHVAHGVSRIRVVGETDFGPTPRDWLEWNRYEAVINHALAEAPLWGLCTYDTSHLPDEVVAAGLRSHRALVTAAGRRANPDYVPPAEQLGSLPVLPEPLEATEPLLAVDGVQDFIGLRHRVADVLAGLHGDPDRVEDLLLAVDEMTSNAVRHGGPPVRLRLWSSADRVVCRISDGGPGMDDPFAGYGPAHGDDLSRGGMGLWLARQLCDHVDVIDEAPGLTIRLATALR